jgi:hypothetical protein
MWFSHLSTPLGPRVRTQYTFIYDIIKKCYIDEKSKTLHTINLECLDLEHIENLIKVSYVDPDIVDVVKTSAKEVDTVVFASYY